jgi:hypothetical protein
MRREGATPRVLEHRERQRPIPRCSHQSGRGFVKDEPFTNPLPDFEILTDARQFSSRFHLHRLQIPLPGGSTLM